MVRIGGDVSTGQDHALGDRFHSPHLFVGAYQLADHFFLRIFLKGVVEVPQLLSLTKEEFFLVRIVFHSVHFLWGLVRLSL